MDSPETKTFWSTKDYKANLNNILPNENPHEWLSGAKKGRIQGASIELSLGDEAFISSRKELQRLNSKETDIKIAPGDFGILITEEYVKISDKCMAFISIKSKHKLYGLINVSGFHIDPGFKGKLKFSVYNAGTEDVILRLGDPIFILFVTYIRSGADSYDHKHEHWNQQHIMPSEMMPLLGTGIPIHNIAHRLNTVETTVKIMGGILVGIMLLLLKMAFGGS